MATATELITDLITADEDEGDTILRVPTANVFLQYSCHAHVRTVKYEQPALDVTEVGTLICPDCGDDMELDSTVIVR